MKYIYKFTLLILLLAFASPVFAYAEESNDTTTITDTEMETLYTVTGIESYEQLSRLEPVEIVRGICQNTDPLLYYVRDNNLLKVNATIEDNAGNITTQALFVTWSFSNSETTVTDTTTCGEYLETGSIALPDSSYKWKEGILSTLTLPVKVYDPEEPIEIVSLEEVWNEFDMAFSLEKNKSIDELLQKAPRQTAWPCFDAAGNEYASPVIYDTSNVKENTTGIYYIQATFKEPLNCRFADTLTIPTYSIPVTVQAPGQPRLDLFYLSANYEFILFPWVTTGINLDTIEVWLSENEGEWRKLVLNDEAYIHDSMLDLYAWYLNEGSSYRIQVKYEGGETGIASFTYEWDMLSDGKYIEGDRDGGDTDGNPTGESGSSETPVITGDNETGKKDPVPTETPANKAPSPTPKPSLVQEIPFSEREKPYLLGTEINLMLKNRESVRFSGGTIMLDISKAVIESLDLADTDRFLVTILPLDNNGFSIEMLLNESVITTLPSMEISMPYHQNENTIPVLINDSGEKIALGNFISDAGIVTFTIQETGTFYVKNEEITVPDTLAGNPLTTAEITVTKNKTNAIWATIIICSAVIAITTVIAIFIYNNKRRT